MPKFKEKNCTIAEIEALPEGQRAELIDGQLYNLAAPSIIHQEAVGFLYTRIRNYLDSKKGTCKVYPAPFAVYLNADDTLYVEPDISVICDPDKLSNGKGCMGAPDWVIEIISPSSMRIDCLIKLFKYRTAGVSEYWIIDPEGQTVIVYNFIHRTMERYTFTDKVKAGIYEDLEIDFSQLDL